jgi:hypothetical protein
MKIERLRMETVAGRPRAVASVTWEDCGRGSFDLHYETIPEFADDFNCDPHAFLVACLFPAIRNGERRVLVDGSICPDLKNGLDVAGGWIRKWYGPGCGSAAIEATGGTSRLPKGESARAASFLSGGIDSLATLRSNRLNYPVDHPGYIRDCFLVYGYDMGCFEHDKGSRRIYDQTFEQLSGLARDTGFTLIPVSTNVRALHDDSDAFMSTYHGPMLASVAHLFGARIASISIASSITYDDFIPWGSHPLLEPNCSSSDLLVKMDGFQLSRLEKTRIVSQWDAGLARLKVCGQNLEGPVNCGSCQKCIRTMLELYVAGGLDRAKTFPSRHITADLVRKLCIGNFKYHSHYYEELYPFLHSMGQSDIVRILECKRRLYFGLYSSADRMGLVRIAKRCRDLARRIRFL